MGGVLARVTGRRNPLVIRPLLSVSSFKKRDLSLPVRKIGEPCFSMVLVLGRLRQLLEQVHVESGLLGSHFPGRNIAQHQILDVEALFLAGGISFQVCVSVTLLL
jgi:hypothetical protein